MRKATPPSRGRTSSGAPCRSRPASSGTLPTGKRLLLALDVSGSMSWGSIAGVPGLTPRDASAALALVTAATEERYEVVGFFAGKRGFKAGRRRQWYAGGDGQIGRASWREGGWM